MADLLLVKGLSPTASEDDLTVPWARDREALQRELGTDEPVAWISHTVGWYLAEAAHELRAISVLLRARTVTGSLGPLVRAVVERVGVTAWILDVEKTDSTERAWRAMLNALVCGSEYRKTVDQLGAPSSTTRETGRGISGPSDKREALVCAPGGRGGTEERNSVDQVRYGVPGPDDLRVSCHVNRVGRQGEARHVWGSVRDDTSQYLRLG